MKDIRWKAHFGSGVGLLAALLLVSGCAVPVPPTVPDANAARDRSNADFTALQRKISAVLREQPLMDALAARYPAPWRGLIRSLADIERDKNSSRATARRIAAFKADMAPQLRDLTARMPDNLLSRFFKVKADTYRWYAKHYPRRCEQALVGGEAGRREMNWLFERLPVELRRRHVQIVARIVRDTPRRSSVLIPRRPVVHQGPVESPALSLSAEVTGCAVISARISRIASLPPDQANQFYRQMLPRKMPAIYRTPARVTFLQQRGDVTLQGRIGHGTAKRLDRLLSLHASRVRRLLLQSEGGLLSEAFALAELVRRHRLVTVVLSRCSSACTVVLMAGGKRFASPYSMIGFHRPAHAGAPEQRSALYQTPRDYRRLYPIPDISEDFLARIARTPSSEVWYPTWQQLSQNGIVTENLVTDNLISSAPASQPLTPVTRMNASHLKGVKHVALALPRVLVVPQLTRQGQGVPDHVDTLLRWAPVSAFAARFPLEWDEEVQRAMDLLPAHPSRHRSFVWSRIEARYDSLAGGATDRLINRGLALIHVRMMRVLAKQPLRSRPECRLRLIPESLRGAFIGAQSDSLLPPPVFEAELQLMADVLRFVSRQKSAALSKQSRASLADARVRQAPQPEFSRLITHLDSATNNGVNSSGRTQCRQNLKLLDHWSNLRGSDKRMLGRQLWRQMH